MDVSETVSAGPRLAIGIGLRSGASGDAVAALVEAAIAQARALAPQADIGHAGLFTVESKRGEPGLHAAAERLALLLTFLPREALAAAGGGVQTQSALSLAHYGVGSVAEAAALAGAGPDSALLAPRLTGSGVTCAVAIAR